MQMLEWVLSSPLGACCKFKALSSELRSEPLKLPGTLSVLKAASLSPFCTELTILSTNQGTACVARTCWNPFRPLGTPTEEY